MSGVRIAIVGNCQVQTLSLAAEQMLENVNIQLMDYSDRSSRDEAVRKEFAESLGDCDFIFAQTALLSYTSEKDLRARYGDKLVTIANFYFRGLFPDSCYVGDFAHRLAQPSPVHSVIVLDAFRRGLTEGQARRAFSIEAFQRLGLLDAWSSSVHEMARREANKVVDVPGGALMEDACRRHPAFLTMNHPAAAMLIEYLTEVFRTVGLRHNHINATRFEDPLMIHDTTPILDLVAEHYRLPYRTSQTFRINSLGFGFTTLEDYIAYCYAAYRASDPSILLCHSPADLVPALRADPALAYLVDADAAVPEGAPEPPFVERSPASARKSHLPGTGQALLPLLTSLDEIKLYTHKIHSFLEIADPKIEQLVHLLTRMEEARQPPPPPRPEPRRPQAPPAVLAAVLAGCALAGALVGSLAVVLL